MADLQSDPCKMEGTVDTGNSFVESNKKLGQTRSASGQLWRSLAKPGYTCSLPGTMWETSPGSTWEQLVKSGHPWSIPGQLPRSLAIPANLTYTWSTVAKLDLAW